MSDKPWRMVEVVLTTTNTNPEVGPWTPLGFAGNRGTPGPPAWGWRGSDRAFHWETGKPSAPVGLLCDNEWRPVPAASMQEHVTPPGGWHRSQVSRQKRDAVAD